MRYVNAFGNLQVICRGRKVASCNLPVIENPSIDFLPFPNLLTAKNIIRYFSIKNKIGRAVRNADIVIARLPSLLGSLAAKEARNANIPYLVEVVGDVFESVYNHRSRMGVLLAHYSEYIMKKEVSKAKISIYVTEKALQKKYPCAGKVYSCTNAMVEPIADEEFSIIRAIRSSRDIYTIGLVGALDVGYKGQDVALECLRRLIFDFGQANVCIRFLGRGDPAHLRAIAERYGVADKVFFDGIVPPGDAVLCWMDRLDILLQASKQEGLSRAVIEGMSRGLPVVATKVGGTDELLDEKWLVEPADLESMVALLRKLLSNPALMQKVGFENLNTSRRYDTNVIENRRQSAFMDLLSYRDGR
ncbi:glycosyltransferase [Sphingopyxis sp. DBS4]|uniref:glycosyltransferase n=1 Tax=Sphingopyxis sp. DBS4 TaxID=2968500 RepID=UPI00214AD6E2|nr:glycosyltransferase [Sphingopyxis sp. DBS4]